MKKLKQIFLIVVLLITSVICLYQFDFIKRSIASQNHRIDLPDYFNNISIDDPESIFVFAGFNGSITQGEIETDELRHFYNKINGEQIMIDEKPMGSLSEINDLTTDNFSIIYRDKANQLNGITVHLSKDNKIYFIEIKGSRV